MVCVTVQKTCERLIRTGSIIAGDAGLHVVHVAKNGEALLGNGNDREALEYLFRISREFGAEMDVLRSGEVIDTITDYARRNKIACIVLGGAGKKDELGFAARIKSRLPGVSVEVL